MIHMSEVKSSAILVTGMPGSGKEEFIKRCIKRKIRVLRMGDLVREEASRSEIELTDEKVGTLAHRMREENGFDHWAKKTLEKIDDRLTVIDGVRGRAELELFKRELGNRAIVVAIHTSPAIRFERLRSRGRTDAPRSWEEFEARDQRELRWGLGDVISLADHMIVNESSIGNFRRKAEAVIDEILGQ